MAGYITTDDLWRKWARDRGMSAPASADVGELAQHYYRAADADDKAREVLGRLLRAPASTHEKVEHASQALHEARGRVALVEEAIERAGGWVDLYRSSTVVMDAGGREVPREEPAIAEVVPTAAAHEAGGSPVLLAAKGRRASAVGW